jgi:hypothetical protein
MEEGTSAFNILTGKLTGKRPVGRPMRSILEWILKEYLSMRRIGLIRLNLGIIGKPL